MEACLLRLPIVTSNIGFLKEFGSYSEVLDSVFLESLSAEEILKMELQSFLGASAEFRKERTELRFQIALEHHTLKHWIPAFISEVEKA